MPTSAPAPDPADPASAPRPAVAAWDRERVARQFAVSRETIDRLGTYVDLLTAWQGRFNLVGRSTLGDVWGRHIADSLQLAELAPQDARVWVDLGTGAGLPGLVLAIALADRDGFCLHLVEANARKCAFLRTAAARVGAPVTVHEMRIEALAGDPNRPRADVVTARALAPLGRLMRLACPFMWKRTVLLLPKGQDVESELTQASISSTLKVDRRPSVVDPAATILLIEEAR
jgi:16S rRNA (guanine527-N7)-methyltransferase